MANDRQQNNTPISYEESLSTSVTRYLMKKNPGSEVCSPKGGNLFTTYACWVSDNLPLLHIIEADSILGTKFDKPYDYYHPCPSDHVQHLQEESVNRKTACMCRHSLWKKEMTYQWRWKYITLTSGTTKKMISLMRANNKGSSKTENIQ